MARDFGIVGTRENCFVFAVYDICREDKAKLYGQLEKSFAKAAEEQKVTDTVEMKQGATIADTEEIKQGDKIAGIEEMK